MESEHTRSLARIKLAELARQRELLHAHYAAVEARAAEAGSPLERLRIVHDGLQQARFAREPLHPDAGNLDVLFFEADVGQPSPRLVEEWLRRLERELRQGRLRAEFAHLFGRLLEGWAGPAPE